MLWWLPVACALAYVVAVKANFHAVTTSLYVNGDAAMAPVLGQLLPGAPAGSFVSLGNHAWYEELLFMRASQGLSFHLALWQIAPTLWSLGGLVGLLAATRRALGAWAAALCGAALLCLGAFGRFCVMAVDWHSLSLVHTVLILGVLMWVLPRAHCASWVRLTAVAIVVGGLSSLPTASDQLFPFWALIPALGTAAIVGCRATVRARLRILFFLALAGCVTLLGAWLISGAMVSSGVTSRAGSATFVSGLGGALANLSLLAQGYAYLGGGQFSGLRLDLPHVIAFTSGLLVLTALLLVLARVARLALDSRVIARTGSGRRPVSSRLVFVCFWTLSLLTTSLVFLLSTAPTDALSGRYLLAGYAAVGALLPVVAERGRRSRLLATAAVCVFALLAVYQVIHQPFQVIDQPFQPPQLVGPQTAVALARFARQERVSIGYGGYWDAEDLTWATGFRVMVRPVRLCAADSRSLCYPQLGMISSWYAPRPRTRSLLVTDRPGVSYGLVAAPDPAFGRPLTRRAVGSLEAYVYSYDIASRLGIPRCHFSWAHPC